MEDATHFTLHRNTVSINNIYDALEQKT